MNYFFTADEHFNHANSIKYCDRPFSDVKYMDDVLIKNFNNKVTNSPKNVTIHAGDFCFCKTYKEAYDNYISRLNGNHVFLMGSHDTWLKGAKDVHEIWQKRIDGQLVVVCHYAMRTWHASHYNSFHLYGHSHGKLEPIGKSWDIGVDNNEYAPLAWEEVLNIMSKRPDNLNLVCKRGFQQD